MKSIMLAVIVIFIAAGFCLAADQSGMIGTYINKSDNKEYITFSANGTFYLKQHKFPPDPLAPFMEVNGKYAKSGDTVTLTLPDGGEGTGTIKGNIFEDNKGVNWVKEGSEEHKVERPKRLKF
jgi:hypothetical protein